MAALAAVLRGARGVHHEAIRRGRAEAGGRAAIAARGGAHAATADGVHGVDGDALEAGRALGAVAAHVHVRTHGGARAIVHGAAAGGLAVGTAAPAADPAVDQSDVRGRAAGAVRGVAGARLHIRGVARSHSGRIVRRTALPNLHDPPRLRDTPHHGVPAPLPLQLRVRGRDASTALQRRRPRSQLVTLY